MKMKPKTQHQPDEPSGRCWQIFRIKDVARINPATRIPKNQLVDFFPMDAIGVNGGLSHGLQKQSNEANGYSQFKNDDVLFAKVTPCFENEKSAIGRDLAVGVAMATTEVTVLRPRTNITSEFLHYRIKGLDFAVGGRNEMKGSAGLKRVPEKFAADFRFELPEIDEQRRIAAWLDLQTARIDKRRELLAKKRELLDELRRSLIYEAITKGVAWNVETGQADSLPTAWFILRIKDAAKLRSGNFITAEKIEPMGAFPVYGGNGLRGYTDTFTHSGTYALVGRQGALCGNVNYATGKFWATEHAVVARPKRRIVTRWLGEMLNALNLNQYATASAQPGLSVEVVVNKFLPFPPFEVQQEIVGYLDQKTPLIDRQITLIDQLDDLLKQQRKAIIHEAVTGKIDLSLAALA